MEEIVFYFEHLAVKIFKYLDLQSLRQCLLVSKEWKHLLLGRKVIWSKAVLQYKIKMLKMIDRTTVTIGLRINKKADSFCELSLKFNICFPDWKEVFQFFEVQNCPRIIVKFLILMDNYLGHLSLTRSWSHPLNFAIKAGKLSYVKLLQHTCLSSMRFQDKRLFQSVNLKLTALEVACQEEKVAIISYLLEHAKAHKIKINSNDLLSIALSKGWTVASNVIKQRRFNRGQKRKNQNVEIIRID